MRSFFIATTCCLVLALTVQAQAKSLQRLFLQGTNLSESSGLTLRGVLGFPNEFVAHPDFARNGWQVMMEHDVKLWSMLVYVMPDHQTAFEHQQRVPLPLTQGVYLLNAQYAEDADLSRVDFRDIVDMPQTRAAVYEGGNWHDGEPTAEMRPGCWRYIPRDNFALFLPSPAHQASFPVQAVPSLPHYGDVQHYRVPAFTRRKVLGINHAYALQERSLRAVFNKTRTMFRQGYRVVFNEDIEQAITALQNQPRRGQSIEMNRYRDVHITNNLRAAFAEDKAFTALLRDPDDMTVAGVVGYVHDNVYSPDSVFGEIDKVKVVDFALMRYLQAQGINFVNAGMVTPYTESINGYRVSRQRYQELQAALPSEPVSLPSGWRDAITIVTATNKLNVPQLERLIAADKVSTPLLLINSHSEERPSLQSTKNHARTASLERLLNSVASYVIYEPDHPPYHGEGELPAQLRKYLNTIRTIEVVPQSKINFMQVSTLSGFPVSLLAALEEMP